MPPKSAVGPCRLRRLEEAHGAEGGEDRLELTGHVHLEHQRRRGDAALLAHLECGHHRGAEERADGLFDEEVDGRLHLGGHLKRARARRVLAARTGAKRAHPRGQTQHASLGLAGGVVLHADVGPEPLATLEALARGLTGHAGGDQQHVHRAGGVDKIVREGVAGAEGDRGAVAEGGGDRVLPHIGDHLVRQEHEDHVRLRRFADRNDLEALLLRLRSVFVVLVADQHRGPGITKVQSDRSAQIAVTENGHPFAREGVFGHVGDGEEALVVRHGAGRYPDRSL